MSDRSSRGHFKPGHKFAKGRPKLLAGEKELRTLTSRTVIEILNKWLLMPESQFCKAKLDQNNSVLDMTVIALIEKAMRTGNITILNFFLDRLIGKNK